MIADDYVGYFDDIWSVRDKTRFSLSSGILNLSCDIYIYIYIYIYIIIYLFI